MAKPRTRKRGGKGRNRAAEARSRGRRLVAFEISAALDELIDAVAAALAAREGRCTRLMALERMGRAGARHLLETTDP